MLSQDSIVWYMNDSVVNRTVIDGNYWINDNYTCEKLNDTWYYYRADTVYQKIEFNANGRTYFNFDGYVWNEYIKCIIYDIPTQYNVKLNNDVTLFSKNNTVFIRSDNEIDNIKVYNMAGKIIKTFEPYSNFITIRFDKKEMLIFDIDNNKYKLLIN